MIDLKQPPWLDDKLGRQEQGNLLARYLQQRGISRLTSKSDEGFVFAVEGSYGVGKSYLLKNIARLLAQEHPVAFIDAWEHDTIGTPMMALVNALDNVLRPYLVKASKKEKAVRLFSRSLTIVAAGVGGAMKKGTERYVGGGLAEAAAEALDSNYDEDDDVHEDVGSAAVEAAIDSYKEKPPTEVERLSTRAVMHDLEVHRAASLALPVLRRSLSQIISGLSKEKGGSPPIFLFIDELDRCSPLYAIKMLEEIKHLFDVPGMVFVLGMEPDQLHKSIEGLYGRGFNAQAYLEKLVNYRYTIPQLQVSSFVQSRLDQEPFPPGSFAKDTLGRTDAEAIISVMNAHGRTLRECDRILEKMRAAVSVAKPYGILDATFLALLCSSPYPRRSPLRNPIKYQVKDVIIRQGRFESVAENVNISDAEYLTALETASSNVVDEGYLRGFNGGGITGVARTTIIGHVRRLPNLVAESYSAFYARVLTQVAPFDPVNNLSESA